MACQGCGKQERLFGKPVDSQTELPVARLIRQADRYMDVPVVVQARIGSVCQTAGCWCLLQEGTDQLYVSMSTFALPRDAAGRQCRAGGRLVMRDDRLTFLASGIELVDE